MQPLGTKKSRNLLGQEIHATSQDKKNHATSRQKNHASSWDKKITQPLGTEKITENIEKITQSLWSKKITQPLGTKVITQPLKTKKITLSLGPIASKLVHEALDCAKLHQTCPHRSK